MAVEHLTATARSSRDINELVPTRYGVNVFESTVEVSAAASDTSTYKMAKIPSNIRILGLSRIYTDDLASPGSPTVDVGLQGTGITADPDAIGNGFAVSAGVVDARLITQIADIGKYAWEFAGESADTNEEYWIYFSIDDADTNTGGTMSLSLVYEYDGG